MPTTFTLIGRVGPTFRIIRRWDYFGIPCVKGISLCGRWQTVARVVDVVMGG